MKLEDIASILEDANEGLNGDWIMIPKKIRLEMIERLRNHDDIGTMHWRENGIMKSKRVYK